ncbi:hypothetical protein BZM27_25535 [Paraburkholderia steynii]|uniref:Integrase catalytic domain-containing protein n=1 Tax=Paraburkholderia steynii TaxID=1245441 RepID=A0A4R0XHN0_9BURK|nr:hypothetical protein BZM27_25535 [Paraburkholderia steynii]
MNSGYRKLVVPDELKDTSKWPCPEENLVEWPDRYFRVKRAIQMRVSGHTYGEVFQETGVLKCEVIRQMHRCLTEQMPGRIMGFHALLPYARVGPYIRTKSVHCDLLSGSAGAAGALEQLFRDHPGARKFIHRKFFPELHGETSAEPCITYVNLHRDFIRFLISNERLEPTEWPLCTRNEGYKSLRQYCDALIEANPERWLRHRKGKQAAWRARIGRGIPSLFDFHEPLVAVQMDYLMCDAAGVVHFKDPKGCDHAIPVKRWYVGLLAETTTSAVLGCYLSFETNPSTDCALETVSSVFGYESANSIDQLARLMPDGRSLMVSLVPELRNLVWAVLSVDNGWCNTSNDFVNNVIDALGCTVMFGTKRAWWQHAVIERVNGALTAMGWKRVLSSYGAGPEDPKRGNATKAAVAYDISDGLLRELFRVNIRDHNVNVAGESNFGNTRVEVFQHLLASDYLPQRLPAAKQDPANLKLLWHCVDCRITANRMSGERPHVNVGYCTYTNPQISGNFGLCGQHIRLWINRRDIRIVHGTLLEDKRSLGALQIERRWSRYEISWQTFTMIMRQLHSHPILRKGDDPVAATNALIKERIHRKGRRARLKLSREVGLAKTLEEAGVGDAPISRQREEPAPRDRGRGFGLLKLGRGIDQDHVRRSQGHWLISRLSRRT